MRALLLVPLLGMLLVGCGGSDSNSSGTTGSSGGEGKGAMDCVISGDKSKANLADLDPDKTNNLVVSTNKGDFTIELDVKGSPCTTASFAGLAKDGFFDGLDFHRIVPDFVIQGGDPNGDGTGGPGYSTVDTPAQDTKYTKGVVAMAKTQTEPPGTAGSQFFVVTAADAQLPADYAVLGKVTDGLDVVEEIGRLGNAQEMPTEKVEIKSIKLSE